MPKKILVVDDEPEICKMVTEFLLDGGYAAAYATNGPDALAKIKNDPPSLVILDIGMPGMDGMEVMRLLHAQFPALPVLVLTGQRDSETVKKMAALGVSEYLTKPIHLETLLDHFVRDMIGTP